MPARQHALDRLLGDQEAAEGASRQCAPATCAGARSTNGPRARAARVVDHDIGHTDITLDLRKQLLHLRGIGGVAGKGACTGLVAQLGELVGIARGQRNAHTLAREQPCQRCAET